MSNFDQYCPVAPCVYIFPLHYLRFGCNWNVCKSRRNSCYKKKFVTTKLSLHLSSVPCLQILAHQSSARKEYKYLIDKNILSDLVSWIERDNYNHREQGIWHKLSVLVFQSLNFHGFVFFLTIVTRSDQDYIAVLCLLKKIDKAFCFECNFLPFFRGAFQKIVQAWAFGSNFSSWAPQQ